MQTVCVKQGKEDVANTWQHYYIFQILDYIQLELVEVPDDLTCTQLLQQWHVPRSDETDKSVLFEDLHFEKASYEKDVNGTKYLERVAVDYNPIPW